MVLSRGLVISLGVSALGCTLLFLYFRNKISSVERKVDVMFDLIQNHQQQQMDSMNTMQMASQQNVVQEDVAQTGAWTEDNLQPERNLIDVSDDEDDGDDSEEVSDSDEDSDEEEQPTISLDKTEDMTLEVSEVKKINIQESDKVTVDETVELQEVEDVTDSLDEIDEDDDDEEEEEEEEKEVKEVVISKLDEEFDYTKLKVSELKAMAEAKNLEGYKSLKKGPLIELLKANE
tara:strand:- start:2318 stop:3016 length:699 start_codon:yes stop_codon:yes gene_type:complete